MPKKKRKGIWPKNHDHKTSQPADSVVAAMAARGYATAQALAAKHDITISTLYTWNRKGQLPVPPGVDVAATPLATKWRGNRWFLVASVDLKMAPPVPGIAS